MTRRFTGWHMLAIMVGMFGTIIAVNLVMATFAVTTFGGTVVDNSYVASQEFNGWLSAAREQARLGWSVAVSGDSDHRAEIAVQAPGGALSGAEVSAVATHPLGRQAQRAVAFVPAHGRYVSVRPLPPGRWLLRIRVAQGGHVAMFDDEIKA
jgi:nitrogen fixation protein FixH